MALRRTWIGCVAAALVAGCAASAPHGAGIAESRSADPERWDRAACLRGDYPGDLDGHAYARARQEDLHAHSGGEASPFAVARLEDRRSAFDARCRRWRAARVAPAK
jgi:hypothetical protein